MAARRTKAEAARLETCKKYMRVDGEDEDEVILSLMSAAQAYLERAGITLERSPAAQYDLALWGLTLHYYDHREAVGNEAAFPIGLRSVITQLKLTAVSKLDTAGEG
jgi:uncharacterized phage protein (predicted DNA packaging)